MPISALPDQIAKQLKMERKKVAFYTLGCKLNFSETSTIARSFQDEGFDRVEFEDVADIYVINTCSVTENADKQFKQVVRKAMKLNEKAFVAAVGCYAQLKPEELAAVDGVDLVLGATEKFKITDYINDLSKNDMGEVHSCEIQEADFYVGSYSIGDRTRAFLKVRTVAITNVHIARSRWPAAFQDRTRWRMS